MLNKSYLELSSDYNEFKKNRNELEIQLEFQLKESEAKIKELQSLNEKLLMENVAIKV